MKSKSSRGVRSGGIGFLGLLTILFVGLKLTGYINWSWWWVLSPLWIGALASLAVVVIAVIAVVVMVWLRSK